MCRMRIGSFCEKIEKGVPYRHSKGIGPKPKRGKFSPLKVPFGTKSSVQHSKSAEWALGHYTFFHVRLCFGLFFQGFLIRSLHIDVFSSLVYDFFFISFLDNSGFCRNNYLVDKYPKINLDKVQIFHNFTVIQSTLLFLCMHPYFKH